MQKDIGDRLVEYSARIIRVALKIPAKPAIKKTGDQLVNSSTSVGANFEEAQAAESKADFIHMLQVSLKEMRESYYWIRVIHRAGLVKDEPLDDLLDESRQLRAILSKSVATAKGKAK